MAVSIRSNISALKAVGRLANATSRVSDSFQKLSSGLRINRAADDASGLAVASALNASSHIKNRARLNVNDGISALQIVDGTLNSVSTLLTRMAELAEQGSNGSYSSTQRKALDKEFNALDREARRLASTTTFNGVNLLSGAKSSRASTAVISSAVQGYHYAASADGRYITFDNQTNGTIQQIDLETNTVSTIATAIVDALASSASGEKIVFASGSNINGSNPSGNDEVWLYDRSTGQIRRVTNGVNAETFTQAALAISADGSTIGFTSLTRYSATGRSSAGDGTYYRPYFYDTNANTFKEYGADVFTNYKNFISLSADGSYAAMFSKSDGLTYTFQTSDPNSTARNLGVSSVIGGGSMTPLIANSGNVYFASTNNLSSLNPNGDNLIWEYNYATRAFRKLTSVDAGDGVNFQPSLNSDGSYLTFLASGNLTGENSLGKTQIFRYDLTSNSLSQITNYTNDTLLYDGTFTTLSSDGNSMIGVDASSRLERRDTSLAASSINIETGNGSVGQIQTQIDALNGALHGLGSHILTTQSSSRGALDAVNLNIQKLGNLRGVIGAGMSRLNTANKLLSSQVMQIDAAKSRITDVDIASESANMIRNSVLQQASTALLAQANQQPQIALALLKF